MTYLHKIDPANHPAANCPLCNDPNHDSLHLFNCPDIPTTLTVWDLWTDPVGVAALLDVWGEKLGRPRAGVWDPVRAHARDGVDTTTMTLLTPNTIWMLWEREWPCLPQTQFECYERENDLAYPKHNLNAIRERMTLLTPNTIWML